MLSTVLLSPLAAVCQPAAKLPLLGHLQAARAIRLWCNELVPLPTQLEIFYFTISFSNPRPFLLHSWLFLLLVLSSGFCFPFFLVVVDVNNVPVDVVAIFLSFTFFTYLLFYLFFPFLHLFLSLFLYFSFSLFSIPVCLLLPFHRLSSWFASENCEVPFADKRKLFTNTFFSRLKLGLYNDASFLKCI